MAERAGADQVLGALGQLDGHGRKVLLRALHEQRSRGRSSSPAPLAVASRVIRIASSLAGPLILVVCVAALVITSRRALSRRKDFARVRSGFLYGKASATSWAPGSAARITDGGQVPAQVLLAALRVSAAPELNADGEDDQVSALGLQLHAGSATNQAPGLLER